MKENTKTQGEGKQEQVKKVAEKVWIGLDLGDKWIYYCVVNGGAEIVERGRVRTRKSELAKMLARYGEAEVGMETGTHCGWVSRAVRDCGQEAVVGHARELKKRYVGDQKNDWRDAESMARILRMDRKLFHPVQLRTAAQQADLSVVRGRAALVEARTKLINTVRSLAKNFGTPLAKCSSGAFVRRVEQAIPAELKPAITPLLASIEELNRSIKEADRQITQLARYKYAETMLFKQVKGVSDLTALTYLLTLWDRTRFQHSRNVGPYLGFTPPEDGSGETVRERGISKAGNRYLRKLLVQSAHYIMGPLGPDCALRRFGLRLIQAWGRSKKAKKRAVVAVARKLAVLLHRLWQGEVYEPLHGIELNTTA